MGRPNDAHMEGLLHENDSLKAERDSLRRELALMREQETAEVRRSLARRKLAQTATAQHESLSQELHLAQSELQLANERSRVQEVTISKLNAQLAAAQRRVAALMQRVSQQQHLIDKRLSGGASPSSPTQRPSRSVASWRVVPLAPTPHSLGSRSRAGPPRCARSWCPQPALA